MTDGFWRFVLCSVRRSERDLASTIRKGICQGTWGEEFRIFPAELTELTEFVRITLLLKGDLQVKHWKISPEASLPKSSPLIFLIKTSFGRTFCKLTRNFCLVAQLAPF
jgi:hypothetical protein